MPCLVVFLQTKNLGQLVMWTYFLSHYGKFGITLLIVLMVTKLFLTFLFQNYERSVVGVISSIFKWYGVTDRDLAENNLERFAMALQNIASMFIYLIAALLLFMVFIFQ